MSVKKSPKIQKLVVNAIRKLQDVQGSTPREISNYISQEYDVPSTKIQRQVRLALARAVSYGILQRSKGGFYACNRDVVGCQQPQLVSGQPTDKCGGRRVRRRRGKSCKSTGRRRRRAAGSCGGRRRRGGGGRRSRRRSRRRGRGKCGGGRRSRRRRAGRSACGGGKRSRRRHSRRRRSRGGRKCATGDERGGKTGDERGIFGSGEKRRRARRSISGARNDNRDRSGSPSVSDEERLDDKRSNEPIESPEISLD